MNEIVNTKHPFKYKIMLLTALIIILLVVQSLSPVVVNTKILKEENSGFMTTVDLYFYKRRGCTFKSASWYSSDHERFPIIFPPKAALLPKSRSTGPQTARGWKIMGLDTLEGSYAFSHHICWGVPKITKFYQWKKGDVHVE